MDRVPKAPVATQWYGLARFYFETLIIYELKSGKFTTHNDLYW